MGADTVSFSEEALVLAGKAKAAAEDDGSEPALADSLQDPDAAASESVTLKDATNKSHFAIMLESLFLADLEENAQASAQVAEDGMPRRAPNPMEDSGTVAEIKKLMTDVASGKADLSDLPKAMGAKDGGSDAKAKSAASRKTAETVEA